MKSLYRQMQGFLRRKPIKHRCPVCGASETSFDPLPDFYRQNAEQHGYQHFGKGEMTSLDTYSCARCGASDRERLYALWLDLEVQKETFLGNGKAIHFAPEAGLANYIRQKQVFDDYQTADLMMETVDHKVDLMDLPFPSNSFDFFICSHVLEHVPDDLKAIHELHRITRPGGRGILMAPIIVGLVHTLEDSSATTEAERWRLFGQYDHVRLYAHNDYVARLISGGFSVEQLGHKAFGTNAFNELGLKPTSVLYIVIKQ